MPSGSFGEAVLPVSVTNSFASLAFLTVAITAHAAARCGQAGRARAPQPSPDKTATTTRFRSTRCWMMQSACAKILFAAKKHPAGRSRQTQPEQYDNLHFNSDAGIWRNDPVPFRLELLRAAYNLQSVAVAVSTVENGVGAGLTATPAMFQVSRRCRS